ncbi:MAG: DUF4169 family protein [bacterium]|nr:DUF4169 family protein [bacterium]
MINVINLNKKKKAKCRLDKEKKSCENRIKFGRTKQEKQIEQHNNNRIKRHLDGHKLDIKKNNGSVLFNPLELDK